MNVYNNNVYDKTDKITGYLDGLKLKLDGIFFHLELSKKKIDGWRCFRMYSYDYELSKYLETNWRFMCKIYSNEIQIALKSNCKYVKADLIIMDSVIRLGDQFTYGRLFV